MRRSIAFAGSRYRRKFVAHAAPGKVASLVLQGAQLAMRSRTHGKWTVVGVIIMKIIGVVGGIASGKSLVSQTLVELGAGLLDADRTGHDLLTADREVRDAALNRWGDSILTANGTIDRSAIAKKVFDPSHDGAADREFLEQLLHPRIRKRMLQLRERFDGEGKLAAVLDAPLLLEAGWGALCDIILYVDVEREMRWERARRRGWTAAEFARREAAQWPLKRKQSAAHVVITNNGTEAELKAAVQDFWQRKIAVQGT